MAGSNGVRGKGGDMPRILLTSLPVEGGYISPRRLFAAPAISWCGFM